MGGGAVGVVGWTQIGSGASGAAAAQPAGVASGAAAPSASEAKGSGGGPAPSATTGAAAQELAEVADDPDDELADEELDAAREAGTRAPQRAPTIKLTDQEIGTRLREEPGSLGPMSVGTTNGGALINGVQMPKGDHWEIIDPSNCWGTRETVDYLSRSIDKVHEQFPNAPKPVIGHISAKRGGRLSPHVSHQSGRDVDISYFLLTSRQGFVRASVDNLDLEKTWAFVKALVTETDVEMILIDTSIQRLLEEFASNHGEDEGWLDQIFQVRGKSRAPLVRHAKGHQNHLHIRFYSPMAQEMGRRAYPMLATGGEIRTESFVMHKAKKGDTLGSLARRYGTTVEAIQRANNLRSNAIQASHVYRIPKKGRVMSAPAPLMVPPRRLPPTRTAVSVR